MFHKHRTLMTLLSLGKVQVGVNSAVEGVVLPKHLMKDRDNMLLSLSTSFKGDWSIHKDRVEAELSFNKTPFKCVIPFDAIWFMRLMFDPKVEGMPSQEELDEEFAEEFAECMPISLQHNLYPRQ